MQKQIDVDPWYDLPTEDLTVGGVHVRVRGLSYEDLTALTEPLKGNANAIAAALVSACVTRTDGKEVIPAKMRPELVKTLQEAVARVNGFNAGNSKATGAGGSSTA